MKIVQQFDCSMTVLSVLFLLSHIPIEKNNISFLTNNDQCLVSNNTFLYVTVLRIPAAQLYGLRC